MKVAHRLQSCHSSSPFRFGASFARGWFATSASPTFSSVAIIKCFGSRWLGWCRSLESVCHPLWLGAIYPEHWPSLRWHPQMHYYCLGFRTIHHCNKNFLHDGCGAAGCSWNLHLVRWRFTSPAVYFKHFSNWDYPLSDHSHHGLCLVQHFYVG